MSAGQSSARPQPPSDIVLDEMETISKARGLQKTLDEFVEDPQKFENFFVFNYFEYNARGLALDYMDKVQKNIYPSSKFLLDMANRYRNDRSDYDFIQEIIRHPKKLKNQRYVETLKNTLKDCVETAFHLAQHRAEFRNNLRTHQILEDTTEIRQKINLLLYRMNNQQQPSGVVAGPATQKVTSAPLLQSSSQQSTGVAVAHGSPTWIVAEEHCRILHTSHAAPDNFVRAYLLALFSIPELLLPLQELPRAKVVEYQLVVKQLYSMLDINWDEKFNCIIKNLRFQKRQSIFRKIRDKIGYAISNTGIEFFFKPSGLNRMVCYSNPKCNASARLPSNQIGKFDIPKNCSNFEYVLFIQRRVSKRSTIEKVLPDGSFFNLQ